MVPSSRMVTTTESAAQQHTRDLGCLSNNSELCITEEDQKRYNFTPIGHHGSHELPFETRGLKPRIKQTCAGIMGTMSGKRYRDTSPAHSRGPDDKRLRLSVPNAQEAVRMDAPQGNIPSIGKDVGSISSGPVYNPVQQPDGEIYVLLEGSQSDGTGCIESDVAPELLCIPTFYIDRSTSEEGHGGTTDSRSDHTTMGECDLVANNPKSSNRGTCETPASFMGSEQEACLAEVANNRVEIIRRM
eukprot:TRINITY_DN7790_c0_g1_i2.p1 TRINITY_DN7790_c0_g1~~TRINITY_DN7790_c0_g1_i2.p1  ORF type:complete len:244 (-),score=37.73 TRINITY_DN7790_c0_g1_i2:60-791(-)